MTAEAAIFDLDGVLAATSDWHVQSWRDAAAAFGFPVTVESLKATRSVPRESSLAALLVHAGVSLTPDDQRRVMDFKNARYLDLIAQLSPADAIPGARRALERCRSLGLRIGVASASLNAPTVLERLGLASLIDLIADPRQSPPKPDPAVFLRCCEALGATPRTTLCLEDAAATVNAVKAAGFYSIAVGTPDADAHEHLDAIGAWNVEASIAKLRAR